MKFLGIIEINNLILDINIQFFFLIQIYSFLI